MTEPKITLKRIEFNENIIAFLGFAILLVSAVLWANRPPTMEKTDFSVTYIGVRMVYLGQGSKLYDLAEQRKLKRLLLPDAEPLIYEHPPFEALLLAPLGALPYKTAYFVWGPINVVIWLILPFLLRPYAAVPRDDLAYFGLLFAPLGVALFQGQSSFLILLLYSLRFIQLKRGHDFHAGLTLGLGLLKFQFIIPFAAIFLLRTKWRFARGIMTTASLLAMLSLVAVGWRGILSYVRLLVNIAIHPDNSSYGAVIGMATVQGFAHALLGKVLSRSAVSFIVAAISASLLVYTAWLWRHVEQVENGSVFGLMFAGAIVVSLIVGFHMFTHDLSPLMLSMLLVAAHPTRPQPAHAATHCRNRTGAPLDSSALRCSPGLALRVSLVPGVVGLRSCDFKTGVGGGER